MAKAVHVVSCHTLRFQMSGHPVRHFPVGPLHYTGAADDMTFVSTAGGGFLEMMKGKPLPGVEALRRYPAHVEPDQLTQ